VDFTQAERDIVEIKHQDLWNGGYVKMFDFSKANSSEAHRIHAVTMIASVCRGDKGIKDKEALYKQLLTEHDGTCGEVFQFVPVVSDLSICTGDYKNVQRFGIYQGKPDGIKTRWLTNLRSMIQDVNLHNNHATHKDKVEYNSKPIKGFHVFKIKIPMMIVQHILRHGQLSFMQVSERIRKLREYYYCKDFFDIASSNNIDGNYDKQKWNNLIYKASQEDFDTWQTKSGIKQELTNKGSHGLAYVTMWIAGWKADNTQWDNFFAVRTKNPSQSEIITLAKTMQEMMEE